LFYFERPGFLRDPLGFKLAGYTYLDRASLIVSILPHNREINLATAGCVPFSPAQRRGHPKAGPIFAAMRKDRPDIVKAAEAIFANENIEVRLLPAGPC
jgi:hypothetical protein